MASSSLKIVGDRAEHSATKSFSKMSQIVTKNINGVDVSFKVSDDKKQVWILLDDNFALAEGYISLRAMMAHYIWCKNEMAKAVVKTEAEQFAPIDENGFFTFEVGRQSKVLSEIYKELRG